MVLPQQEWLVWTGYALDMNCYTKKFAGLKNLIFSASLWDTHQSDRDALSVLRLLLPVFINYISPETSPLSSTGSHFESIGADDSIRKLHDKHPWSFTQTCGL